MAKYKTVRTCYYANRLFAKGEVAIFDDSAKVPEHFQLIEEEAKSVEVAVDTAKAPTATKARRTKKKD